MRVEAFHLFSAVPILHDTVYQSIILGPQNRKIHEKVLLFCQCSTAPYAFSQMRSEGSRFTWESGVKLCSPKVAFATASVRNRSQPSATLCVSAVRLSSGASAPGNYRESVSKSQSNHICRRIVILVFAEEVSV